MCARSLAISHISIMKRLSFFIACLFVLSVIHVQAFVLCGGEYYNQEGVDVMAFSDFYPEGHQGGISLLMNGKRVATNGDLRFEPTPGQWQPIPKKLSREVSAEAITTKLCFPDSSRHLTGFNPMIYPDVQLHYSIRLEPKGDALLVTVDLDEPIPAQWVGRVGFNLELFPGELMGKPYLMDDKAGIYPQQPNSPVIEQNSYLDLSVGDFKPNEAPLADVKHLMAEGYSPYSADQWIAAPYAVGRTFTSRPDDPLSRFIVRSLTSELKLYDGRMNHNNGWFVLRSEVPSGVTQGAVQWVIEPSIVKGWRYEPVVQVSQVGYLTGQKKTAVIERDMRDEQLVQAQLIRLTAAGEEVAKSLPTTEWQGHFLRYRYALADFSDVQQAGLYCVEYNGSRSTLFRIGDDVYERGVWQPVVEYFLPVQMCHMRVSEKYKVWHDRCHMDDALMAQPGNHIDGYDQKTDNHTHFQPGDPVPGLNIGGWHDAGDFDLRVESQAGECYILAMAYEQFCPQIDATTIDQEQHAVEIHQPDGRNDVLQQIEHGALTVVAGYKALGRLYRGIICNNLRQYVLLGDAAAMTDGKAGNDDDRWVYTEVNPTRELTTAAHLAATSRVLQGFNDELANECLAIARALYDSVPTADLRAEQCKLQAAAELFITTREPLYLDYITSHPTAIMASEKSIFNNELAFSTTNLAVLSRVEPLISSNKSRAVVRWRKTYRQVLEQYSKQLAQTVAQTPYGVPYQPSIWGAGWDIQRFGMEHYFLAKQYPDLFPSAPIHNALHFVLGCHPGLNRRSFAGGIGTESTTVGYGLNRAEWSYIPGGVVSGTALIRPDFPELLVFPYLWQQVEYVLGGGSSNFLFLVLAAQALK